MHLNSIVTMVITLDSNNLKINCKNKIYSITIKFILSNKCLKANLQFYSI